MASINSAASSGEKVKSELANVSFIGTILVSKKILTQPEADAVVDEVKRKAALNKADPSQPKPGFFGEEALNMKKLDESGKVILGSDNKPFPLLTKERLNQGLEWQAKIKAEAAMADLTSLVKGNKLDTTFKGPNGEVLTKEPHWGNGGFANNKLKSPTAGDAASSAANIAELIVLLANKKPEILKDTATREIIQQGVESSKDLALYILGDQSVNLLSSDIAGATEKAKGSLRLVAVANNVDEKIYKGYIENRFSEVAFGAEAQKTERLTKATKEIQESLGKSLQAGNPGFFQAQVQKQPGAGGVGLS